MTLWAVDLQAPLSMEFPRQEYWSELPFPFPRDLPHLGQTPPCTGRQILFLWATREAQGSLERGGWGISGKLFFFALMIKSCSGPEKWFLCYYQHRFTFLGGIVTSFAPLCLFLEKRKSVVGCQNSSHNFAHYAIRFDLLSPIYWLRTKLMGSRNSQ